MDGSAITLVVVALLVIFALVVVIRTVRIVPQQTAQIVERLGSYSRTLDDGMHFLVPFVDKVRANIDLREQVVTFPPQPVITSDNLVVSIDTVIYYTVNDAKSAVYEIANFIQGIEQLTVTTLRNVIGSLDLEQTLTSRDQINAQLRGVLDQETGRWGIRVNRVELKAIDPPHSIQDSMEKQMRAERDRRAAILNAEGVKQSAILSAEGEKQSQILRAEGSAQARILEAQGQARAIQQVFGAIHRGKPTQRLLAYQYLQVLPQLARGDSNKMWIIPSEVTDALRGISGALGGQQPGVDGDEDDEWVDPGPEDDAFAGTSLQDPAQALAEARGQAGQASAEATESASPAHRGRGGIPSIGQGSPVPPAAPVPPAGQVPPVPAQQPVEPVQAAQPRPAGEGEQPAR
jgi:regulator of protease activity HflC (stomatin/prohibitin superfamily)